MLHKLILESVKNDGRNSKWPTNINNILIIWLSMPIVFARRFTNQTFRKFVDALKALQNCFQLAYCQWPFQLFIGSNNIHQNSIYEKLIIIKTHSKWNLYLFTLVKVVFSRQIFDEMHSRITRHKNYNILKTIWFDSWNLYWYSIII